MHSRHCIAAATAIVVLAAGPAFAQTTEAVDSTARGGVKGALDLITAEEAARIAADDAEAGARMTADDAEAATRAAADAALQTQVSALPGATDLDNEEAARKAADAAEEAERALQDFLESQERKDADAAEAAARAAADTALQAAINTKTPMLLRTLVVSPVGRTPLENCDVLRSALASIIDNAADSPYLVKVEPGLYDCGTAGVAMKPFVDIEGSGRGTTTIRGTGPTVIGASDAELRFLSVEANSAGATLLATELAAEGDTVAIAFADVSSFRVTRVTATASAASGFAAAFDGTGEVSLSDVIGRAHSDTGSAAGMRLTGRTSWQDVTCEPGVSHDGSLQDWADLVNPVIPDPDGENEVTIIGSTLRGNVKIESSYTLNIVASQFDGAVTADPGADVNCFAVFDGTFEPRGPDCLVP